MQQLSTQMPSAQLRSPTMASNTSSSDRGSPGPSIHYKRLGYGQQPSYNDNDPSALPEIEHLRRELEDARIRIDRDTGVINSLHEKVTQLDELVKKQQVTISNQSKTISDRRPLRKQQSQIHAQVQSHMAMGFYPMTPSHHHHVHQCQYPGSGTSGVPPCSGAVCVVHNTLSPFESQTSQAQSQAQTPQSAYSPEYASQGGTVFDQPPPKFEIPLGAHGSSTQVSSSGLVPNFGRPSDVFSPFTSTTVSNSVDHAIPASSNGAADCHKKMADFSNRFQALMRMSEIFGQTHASLPNIFMDSHMDDHVKEYLMAISRGTKASDLLGNAATRGFFVAKAINWYLVEKVLCMTAISGFDASVDVEISQIQKQMASSTPIMRHIMLTAIATHIAAICKRPGFAEYNQQNIQVHLHRLWAYIGPLGHDAPANQNSSMWNDLHAIISEAQSLATDMYSMPLEYRFEFPEQSEPFDPQTMINRDPWVLADPSALQNTDTRVRLGITPIARVRDNSQSPGDVQMVYMGHVLLKGPKKQML
ncbi:uncharacterized protein DSM5745_01965 [Aspergillus mulundensis]|uniref:Uncharacterized protein n=1 Tax=Aspergillus mulundensis TaxID=1810919 RepID=A0A3D8SV67_9EURO|nr:Uncharacterized protein DSM5745_01965 [Aspergillus mulundensis]RDW90190.1 Uncharacterized protein DSM5745_01965 [Aspergillus mulundensis]